MNKQAATKKKGGVTKHFARGTALPTGQGQFAVPTFSYKEETVETFLSKVWDEGTSDQIETLIALEYPTGKKIIDIERKSDIIIEIVGMLKAKPFDEIIEFLKHATGPNYIFWEQDAMEPSITKLQREIALNEEQEIGVKGVGRCRFCSSNELVFEQKQTRSGDEPATIFVRCVMCGKNWRQ